MPNEVLLRTNKETTNFWSEKGDEKFMDDFNHSEDEGNFHHLEGKATAEPKDRDVRS